MSERVSVVIPAFNETGNIARLLEDVSSVLDKCQVSYEIVVVDDCSQDDTYGNLVSLQDRCATL